jgi:hypothetical protein
VISGGFSNGFNMNSQFGPHAARSICFIEHFLVGRAMRSRRAERTTPHFEGVWLLLHSVSLPRHVIAPQPERRPLSVNKLLSLRPDHGADHSAIARALRLGILAGDAAPPHANRPDLARRCDESPGPKRQHHRSFNWQRKRCGRRRSDGSVVCTNSALARSYAPPDSLTRPIGSGIFRKKFVRNRRDWQDRAIQNQGSPCFAQSFPRVRERR